MAYYPPPSQGSGPQEGTAILSTGETGGVKVLTEDGSGGATWETPAGGGLTASQTASLINIRV